MNPLGGRDDEPQLPEFWERDDELQEEADDLPDLVAQALEDRPVEGLDDLDWAEDALDAEPPEIGLEISEANEEASSWIEEEHIIEEPELFAESDSSLLVFANGARPGASIVLPWRTSARLVGEDAPIPVTLTPTQSGSFGVGVAGEVELELAGVCLTVHLVSMPGEGRSVRLGRDALNGRFLIDPAEV